MMNNSSNSTNRRPSTAGLPAAGGGGAFRRRSSVTSATQHQQHQQQAEAFTIPSIPLPPPGSSRRPSLSSSICERVPKPYKKLNHSKDVLFSANRPSNVGRRTLSESTTKLNEMMATNLSSIEKSNKQKHKNDKKKKSKTKKVFKTELLSGSSTQRSATAASGSDEYDDDDDEDEDDDYSLDQTTGAEKSLRYDEDGNPIMVKKKKKKRKIVYKTVRKIRKKATQGDQQQDQLQQQKPRSRTQSVISGGPRSRTQSVMGGDHRLKDDEEYYFEEEEEEIFESCDDDDDDEEEEEEEDAKKRGEKLAVALLEQAAALVGILAPPDLSEHKKQEKTGPTEEELERERQLEWERNNRIRPVDDDYRDFLCPKRWSSHRRVDAKMEFFRNSDAAVQRLQERMKFYKQCDKEVLIAARDGQEYRQRKLAAMLVGMPAPPRPPSSSRPASARSWTEERKRRQEQQEAAAAAPPPPAANNKKMESSSVSSKNNTKSPDESMRATAGTKQQQKSSSPPAKFSDIVNGRPRTATSSRPVSARLYNPTQRQLKQMEVHRSYTFKNEHYQVPGAAGDGFNGDDVFDQHQQRQLIENSWVQRNYGELHHIPIVEIPPRDAKQWHRRNELWLQRAMRHRSHQTRDKMIAEHERLSKAFYHHHADDPPPPVARIPYI